MRCQSSRDLSAEKKISFSVRLKCARLTKLSIFCTKKHLKVFTFTRKIAHPQHGSVQYALREDFFVPEFTYSIESE